MNFDAVIEAKIREAIEQGQFDNLPGKGRPLRLDENPHEPEAWRMAHKLLHDQGFTLPWIADRKEIEEAVAEALKALARHYPRSRQPDVWARAEWRRAGETFAETVKKLNRRIRDYNLSVPNPAFQRLRVDAEKEVERVVRESATAAMWNAARE
jgi:DnaJ family protein C protein 28